MFMSVAILLWVHNYTPDSCETTCRAIQGWTEGQRATSCIVWGSIGASLWEGINTPEVMDGAIAVFLEWGCEVNEHILSSVRRAAKQGCACIRLLQQVSKHVISHNKTCTLKHVDHKSSHTTKHVLSHNKTYTLKHVDRKSSHTPKHVQQNAYSFPQENVT